MIIATHRCGCPAALRINEPQCSPCCKSSESNRKVEIKNETDSSCCPGSEFSKDTRAEKYSTPGNKLVSEITEKGLPYKEVEAIINDNRVVMRIQDEPVKEQYDPPCDCVPRDNKPDTREDSTDSSEETGNSGQEESSTVVLYPQPSPGNFPSAYGSAAPDAEKKHKKDATEKTPNVKPIDQEENPNVFLLRIRRRSSAGEKKHNIDLECKIPRPWSRKRRLEREAMRESPRPEIISPPAEKKSREDSAVQVSARKRKRK